MSNDVSYASVDEIRSEIKTNERTSADLILKAGRQATAKIDRAMHTGFMPYLETRNIPIGALGGRFGHVLTLGDVAMEIVSVGNEDDLLDTDTYTAYPFDRGPYIQLIRGQSCSAWSWLPDACLSTNPAGVRSVPVTARWGFHDRYALEGWRSLTTVGTGGITGSATTLVVGSVEELSPGQLIRVGDEYMAVVDVSADEDAEITVKRGVRGTTAAAHVAGVDVDLFQVMQDVVYACARWAALAFQRRGAFEQTSYADGIAIEFPAGMPKDARDALNNIRWPVPLRRPL